MLLGVHLTPTNHNIEKITKCLLHSCRVHVEKRPHEDSASLCRRSFACRWLPNTQLPIFLQRPRTTCDLRLHFLVADGQHLAFRQRRLLCLKHLQEQQAFYRKMADGIRDEAGQDVNTGYNSVGQHATSDPRHTT